MGAPTRLGLRRRVASIVLLAGGLALGNYLCVTMESVVPVELRYRLGDPPAASAIDVELVREGETAPRARFASRLVKPETVHKTRVPPGMYSLKITVEGRDGQRRELVRSAKLAREAVVTIDLRAELAG